MATDPTVVRNCTIATKMELHSLVMPGWARGVKAHGKGGWADKLGISTVALDKQLTGSMPGLECIDKALDVEPTVLDDWLDRKGKRLVDKEHDEGVRDLTLLLAQVNLKIAEAQHPSSPGGEQITHSEYLGAESLMRELHAATGRWIERCNDIRKPTSLRSVA
jgi:hypothetical protein